MNLNLSLIPLVVARQNPERVGRLSDIRSRMPLSTSYNHPFI